MPEPIRITIPAESTFSSRHWPRRGFAVHWHHPREQQDLKRDLEMPLDAYTITAGAENPAKMNGYTFEIFGTYAEGFPPDVPAPLFRLQRTGPLIPFAAWRWRVLFCGPVERSQQ